MTKEEQSIKFIEGLYDDRKENIVAFSGGKDSVVLYHLTKKTNLKFDYVYCNTTIDPPNHISFIRKNFPDVRISQPRYSFYQLIEKYGLPTRMNRFCCQHLKEYVGKGAKVFEGVRIDEGSRRKSRLSKLKEPESCDTRIKNKIHAYPIMYWTNDEIWKYIHDNNLPVSDFYSLGFPRLGCVGCPMGTQFQRIVKYRLYPRFVYAAIKAIDKNIQAKRSISKFFDCPYEAFYWWISNDKIILFKEKYIENTDFKAVVKKLFPLNTTGLKRNDKKFVKNLYNRVNTDILKLK
jgi:phosphoadenosine phosphosulfate reductase